MDLREETDGDISSPVDARKGVLRGLRLISDVSFIVVAELISGTIRDKYEIGLRMMVKSVEIGQSVGFFREMNVEF